MRRTACLLLLALASCGDASSAEPAPVRPAGTVRDFVEAAEGPSVRRLPPVEPAPLVSDAELRARVAACRAALAVLDSVAPAGLAADSDTILVRGLCDDVIARAERALRAR